MFETQNWSCLEGIANEGDGVGGTGMECRVWGWDEGVGMKWYWVLGAGYGVLLF